MRPIVAIALLAAAPAVVACGDSPSTPATASVTADTQPVVIASAFGKHGRVPVEIITRKATGVDGDTIRHYTLTAKLANPPTACVNARDRQFKAAAVGAHVRAKLDPRRGEGGDRGWCIGRYRGTVTYFEGYACPPEGTCQRPEGFPTRSDIVGRFTFEVR